MNMRQLLEQRLDDALVRIGVAGAGAQVATAARPEFGDYQANGMMGAAKREGRKPRELAQAVVAAATLDDIVEAPEIAGPGFINLRLRPEFLSSALGTALAGPAPETQTIVIDYSAPNLAKEMHVGHLRSTILGDAMARILDHLGHDVIRQNHLGDWGTQFGMLLAHLEETGAASDELADLEQFYVAAKQRFDSDVEFADRARRRVVALQSGDPDTHALWRQFIDISVAHCDAVYRRLDVTLRHTHIRGESAYNDDIPEVLEQLRKQGLLEESQGAQCVYLDQFKARDGEPLPLIVRKSDGGYLYASTDLAAVRYRCRTLRADRVLYVVGTEQSLHFQQVFAVARRAGFCSEQTSLEHIQHGSILGKDGRKFSTREGGTVKLVALLDEAEQRAYTLVSEKSPGLDEAERRNIAHAVGIGALKYADLSKNRISNYVFDWDQMLSFDGNTAPYLQYAYTRIRSLFRRGGVDPATLEGEPAISEEPERQLAVNLMRLQEVLEQVVVDVMPSHLCTYLHALAASYMQFYERCPVLSAGQAQRRSRLLLCRRTADTLQLGLRLLGIETVERM